MSTLEDLTTGPGGVAGFVGSLSRRFRPVTRRSLLLGATVAATALATKPKEYVLRPVPAYATICGPGNTASSGWTVFCCTINNGVNACPPGSFAAGWWKAADSSWCGAGYRYIVDCNASCSKCTSGCSDGICDSRCWSCSCGSGSTATCDQRRVCCNAFRYGQCNTQVKCSGGVHCRVVSCVPPYRWTNCTTTSLVDNRTSEHSAPCLPVWNAIERKYDAMGAQGSYLRASITPSRSVGDGRGVYVRYQGGGIYWTSTTGAIALTSHTLRGWDASGGVYGQLRYPIADPAPGRRAGGWIQAFEHGALAGASNAAIAAVYEPSWTVWKANNREAGPLGYPVAARVTNPDARGWHQQFQGGFITDSPATPTVAVYETSATIWVREGREAGPLGYPTAGRTVTGTGMWIQLFEGGAIADTGVTTTTAVYGVMYAGWQRFGREAGLLKYPTASVARDTRGAGQTFQGGQLWALGAGPARLVYGSVLTGWTNAGGAAGSYGYPVTDTTATGDGRLTCQFEGGTITA
ncbi:hypothetical protein [Nostocoides sp. HKS02]|uniref:hypothetical protein n=1 Tax=Nostocoides sp. HKS02 TaxID=1813880 RepID=UPI0012B4451B|nr:hypothetical protein [Tetrasphaera sp. HKS02]QGN58634.1 hypothetical protein GKE56_12925 [Tetrasphaera sp. HKS02]